MWEGRRAKVKGDGRQRGLEAAAKMRCAHRACENTMTRSGQIGNIQNGVRR